MKIPKTALGWENLAKRQLTTGMSSSDARASAYLHADGTGSLTCDLVYRTPKRVVTVTANTSRPGAFIEFCHAGWIALRDAENACPRDPDEILRRIALALDEDNEDTLPAIRKLMEGYP